MGLLFCKEDVEYPDKVICYKCGDKFYTDRAGFYSKRNSCRYHDFDEKNVCYHCHKSKLNCNGNCYHIKKTHWFDRLVG